MDAYQHRADLEAALRDVPRMHDLPAHLAQACMDAAFAERSTPPAARHLPRRRKSVWWAAAAAVIAVALGAASALGPVGRSDRSAMRRVVLHGSGRASAVVRIGAPAGGAEAVVVSVTGLPTAPSGHHYEMWFRTGEGAMPVAAFNTGRTGAARLTLRAAPSTRWVTCWISLDTAGRGEDSQVVLRVAQ